MSNITSIVSVNVPKEVKDESNIIFNNLGLNMSTAINIFLKKVISERGIPFEIKESVPNKELIEALQEGEDILDGKIKKKGHKDIQKMFDDIFNED